MKRKMATYIVNVSSDNRLAGENTDSYTVNFTSPMIINGNWAVALESLTMWYSYYNITPDYGNNLFRYYNGTAWRTITITPGLYTVPALNTFIQENMAAAGDYTAGPPASYFITITPNYSTFKCDITISGGYQIDFTVGNLYILLGFTQAIISANASGPNNVNISNSVDRLLLHCNLVSGSFLGAISTDVLYSFSVSVSPSSLLELRPNRLLYVPIPATGYLREIKIYLTDQMNRRVNLNGEPLSVQLYMKRI
jgi:hypothetical protein